MKYVFSVLYNASFDGYGNCVASKCTNGSQKKVAERCESPHIPSCGLYIIIKKKTALEMYGCDYCLSIYLQEFLF